MTSIDLVIAPRERDLGGFSVRRILPYAKRRMVGPFIFIDEMGPARFAPGEAGIDVRPHPHIGLATLTYLFDGEIHHRDSLGYDQLIRPGDVNWMVAGRGIAHSERVRAEVQAAGQSVHGLQIWIALPDSDMESEPAFYHHPGETLPTWQDGQCIYRLIAGEAYGHRSPVKTYSPLSYIAIETSGPSKIQIPNQYRENAIYIVSGSVNIEGTDYSANQMVVFADGQHPQLDVKEPGRIVLFGGEPIGKRLIWWNFVAQDETRLQRARDDWNASIAGNFSGTPFSLPPDENEWIDLPE